jgi:tetratricopeptide (TPR) repeat protein
MGCSLAPSAASRSQKAFNAGEYAESIRIANYALSTYEYNVEEKSNLLFLKAESYAKLKQYTDAYGVMQYILNTYPETEAYYRAKTLLSSVSQYLKKLPNSPPVNKNPAMNQNI